MLLSSKSVPRTSKRGLIVTTVLSSVVFCLYAAPVWGAAVNVRGNLTRLQSLHRRTLLAVMCGYRAVSYDAACLLGSAPPVELKLKERMKRYEGMRKRDAMEARRNSWKMKWTTPGTVIGSGG
ncbi:uncharacterized protein LOC142320049 [Lycorma delicatula]|uniref:uncharacterized protein LOC142320049 n=1 Tax=Lycorma delicatula TaxID=130591 RepID=UPI003F519F59